MPLLKPFLHGLRLFSASGKPIVVGVSGGPDSLCLLHLFYRASARLSLALHVATLDHGLRGADGAADADFVEQTAQAWRLPVHRAYRDVASTAQKYGLGLEEAARRTRYTFLAQVAREVGASLIAVGHNADDQAETILMHLIRGSGLAGLRGMLPAAPLGPHHLLPDAPPVESITLIRPLLDVPRAAIDAYCAAHDLEPRQDATNIETAYFRNHLRHDVMPLLATLNPHIRQTLARTGHILAADYALTSQVVADVFRAALREQGKEAITLDRAHFRQPGLTVAVRRGLIREAVGRIAPDLRDVSYATLEQAVEVASHGPTGSEAVLPGGITLRVEGDTLTLHRPGARRYRADWPWLPPGTALDVAYPGDTPLPGTDWTLQTRWLAPDERPAAFYGHPFTATLVLPEHAVLTLRTRRAGDRFMPLGLSGHSQKLSDTLINARVPAAQRDHLPILTVNGEIAWLTLGTRSRIAARFAVGQENRPILLVCWRRFSPNP